MTSSRRSDKSTGGLVYSTGSGRMCPACRNPVAECRCALTAPAPAAGGIVRVTRESKGRGGKVVTVIRGLSHDPPTLIALSKQLKTLCGAGGTVKDGVIELQGDHCERTIAALKSQAYMVKRAGG